MNERIEICRTIRLSLNAEDWKLTGRDSYILGATANRLNRIIENAVNRDENSGVYALKLCTGMLELFYDSGVTKESFKVLEEIFKEYLEIE